MSVESLGGRELEWYFRNVNEGVEHLSPSPRLFITQIGLEPRAELVRPLPEDRLEPDLRDEQTR